jgi:hypothetical protein
MSIQSSWKTLKVLSASLPLLASSLPLLTLGIASNAKAEQVKPLCAEIEYSVSVCAEKKGSGYDIYATLGPLTSQKQYVGVDGVEVTFGTIDLLGTHAQAHGGIKSNPLRLEAKLDACFFSNCAKKEFVLNLKNPGNPSNPQEKGVYQLYYDGQQVGYEPSWTRDQAVQNLQWNKVNHPTVLVEGWFKGQKVGYELYWDGKRVGFEPTWTLQQAINNLQSNKTAYPQKRVEGLLNGQRVGYELYWEGKRAGFEPTWTRQQAINNLQWNKTTYPNKTVEGLFNGERVGYELYWDGKRAGFEPTWTRQQALDNFQWNKKTYPQKKVQGLFDGIPLP